MNKFIAYETFLNKQDADNFMDDQLEKLAALGEGWFLEEAKLKYVNGGWVVGVLLGKGQLELDI